MGPTRRRKADRIRQPGDRRRRRNLALLASALVTLPVALSADVAVNLVTNTAEQSPLAATRTFPGQDPAAPPALGATGASPHDSQLSPQILHEAGNQQALATGAGPQANLPSGPLGIPGVVLDAYLHAQQVMGVEDPGCHLPWWLLAGIGKIESNQAENGEVDANGTTLSPILGPALDGSNGFADLPAAGGGFQRAQGPMQFIPSTWAVWGHGGDINNVYDSALAAGRYLCAGGGNLSQPAAQATAVFSYNHSDSYVRIVLIWANAYRQGVTPLPETVAVADGPLPSNRQSPAGPGTTPTGSTGPGSTGPGGTTPAGKAPGSPAGSAPAGSSPSSVSKPPGSGATVPGRSPVRPTPTGGGTTTGTTTTDPAPPPDTTTTPPCPTPPTDTTTPTPTDTPPPPPGCATTTTAAPPAAQSSADPAAGSGAGANASDSTPAT